jgi:hypothetical protein
MIHYLAPADDDTFSDYLATQGRALRSRMRVVYYEDVPGRVTAGPGTYVFTGLDTVAPRTWRRAADFARRLADTPGAKVMNDPSRLLGRFALLDTLWRAGRNEFRAVRACGDVSGLRFPVFLRDERSHDGALSPFLWTMDELTTWVGRAILLGVRRRDLLAVEFCDTADNDGLYRKYAAFVIGGRVVSRGLAIGRAWMLKNSSLAFSRAMVLEEAAHVRENPHGAELAEICALAHIDYGRVDYAVKERRLQIWEINSNPEIRRGGRRSQFPLAPELSPIRNETKVCFYDALEAAWTAVDVPSAPDLPGHRLRRHSLRASLVPHLRRQQWRRHLPRLFRPVRPVLAPVVRTVSAWVGRAARSRANVT